MAQAKKKAAAEAVILRDVIATACPSNEAKLTANIMSTKAAIGKHLDAICDHMNVLDQQGIEVQFGVNKNANGQFAVLHHFALRRY